MESLSALDKNFWSISTPTTQQVIGVLCTLDAMPSEAALAASVQRLAEIFPRLTQRIEGQTFPKFVPDTLWKPHYHYTYQANELPDISLEERASRFLTAPLSAAHSPWHVIVFKHRTTVGSKSVAAGFLFLIHHALTDGLAGLRVFLQLLDAADAYPGIARNSTKGVKDISTRRSIARLIHEYFDSPPPSLVNGKNSSSRKIATVDIDATLFHNAARSIRVSSNDLYLACVTETISRYHQAAGEPLGKLRAIMPVNLRNAAETALGNHLTGVGVPLPHLPATIAERAKTIRSTVRALSANDSLGAYRLLAQINGHMPGILRRLSCDAAARRTNFICTNMPGATKEIAFCGATVLGCYGLPAPMRGHGAAFCLLPSTDKAAFSIVIDPEIVTASNELRRFFKECLNDALQLGKSVSKRTAVGNAH